MKTLLRLLRLAKSYRLPLVLAVIGMVAAALTNLITPALVRQLTAGLSDSGTLTLKVLGGYCAMLVGAYLVRAFGRFLSMSQAHVAAWNFVGELTLKVYDKYQTLSMAYYDNAQTGVLMSRMVNDTRMLEQLIAHLLPDLITNVLMIVGVAVMILTINPVLALITMIPVPVVLVLSRVFSKKVMPLFHINARVLGELNGVLQDNLSGMREIQTFGKEEYEHEKMTGWCRHYSDVNIRANYVNGVYHPSVELITSLGTVAVMGIGGALALRDAMPIADIVGFFMYLSLFYSPLTALARLVEDVQSAIAGGTRVLEVLDTESEVQEAPDAVDIGMTDGRLELDHVTFAYDDGKTVLDDVSFAARPGEMIALVGATGVGKTTICSLLERFYDPSSGVIRIGGKDIRGATLHSLRKNIAVVLQNVFLFNGTVAENIAYGADHPTEQEIRDAAVIACADEFIRSLPDGYDTKVGERGTRLSGGQKQRIAIARAILRGSPILILDEATSAVDNETEAKIQEALERLAGTRTMLVIAHRLSTIRRADTILVMENGRIVERGNHEELMAKGGVYAKLAEIQYNRVD